ncbi:histidine kinase [Galbibacter sp. EGI 63066]|uniref:tetratricopeptide repeat-containing sensor histidine kinase n=1 Tax=Galbibacter sp. EGI 63066 TaxID=2993559 RepID=UPI00224977DD|nr:histidine kinase dimerization/phosphoacceptor domain -containing protein [Galbibacter sp. EGI 63066]MCX2680125.1 histidine kinase [Galbibacter sp. EGI 63066]
MSILSQLLKYKKETLFIVLLLMAVMPFYAQSTNTNIKEKDPLEVFLQQPTAQGKFNYFFNTEDKYKVSSVYTWLDSIASPMSVAEIRKDSVSIYKYRTVLSQLYYDVGNYDKGILIAELLYQKNEKLDKDVKTRLLKIMDNLYGSLQLYDKQLEVRRGLKYSGEDVVLYDIYADLGLYRQAMMEYIMSNKEAMESSGDQYEKAKYYNDLGFYLLKDGSIFTAIKNIETAKHSINRYLMDNEKITSDQFDEALFLEGQIESNLGKCRMLQNKYREAIPYLETGVSAARIYDMGRYSQTMVDLWGDLAECYLETGNLRYAKAYLDSIVSKQQIVKSHSVNYNRLRANYHLKDSNPDSASLFFKRYVKLIDSLDYNSKKKQLLSLLVQFDLNNQKETIARQRLNIERNKAEILEREKTIYVSVTALGLCVVCVIGLIVAYIISIKNKRLIENQKMIIENSLVEKDSLLKEIHHRVKNNLQMVSSLLSLQTKNTRSRAAISALEEGKSRVKAMALIHQKLYQNEDLSVIEMQEYIESLSASIQSVYKKEGYHICMHINAKGTELDVDRAIPIGLILNELISNSFKYAFENNKKGNIYINLKREEGIFFEYMDDGIGFPEESVAVTSNSMGMNLVSRLADQLRSKLHIDTGVQGVRFWFYFN